MLISQKELEKVTEYQRTADIERWLVDHGVKFWHGKGGKIVTTTEAINSALLPESNGTQIEFG